MGPDDHSLALESTDQILGENHGISAGARQRHQEPTGTL